MLAGGMNLLDSLISGRNQGKKETETFFQTPSLPSLPSLPEQDSTEGIPKARGPKADARPDLPEAVLLSRYPLAEICRLTLEGNPEARQLSPKR